jgi:hypothetical protein
VSSRQIIPAFCKKDNPYESGLCFCGFFEKRVTYDLWRSRQAGYCKKWELLQSRPILYLSRLRMSKEGEMYQVEGNVPLQPKDDGNIYE